MKQDEYAKAAKVVNDFFEANQEIFIPDEEISEIIRLVKTEKEEDLLRMKLNVILQEFSNKVAKWKEQNKG
ncbi:hypothetical protein OA46_10010 [Enterobacter cloacae]|nr:hypothetical protein OA46_10010 [Enterobacter cloacae]